MEHLKKGDAKDHRLSIRIEREKVQCLIENGYNVAAICRNAIDKIYEEIKKKPKGKK